MQCTYSAQGNFACPVGGGSSSSGPSRREGFFASVGLPIPKVPKESFFSQPAWVSGDAKKGGWAERSAEGFPVPATEWQDGVHESYGRVE